MTGHPALAYTIALQQLDERRHRPSGHRETTTASRKRTMKLGRYRLTLTKEVGRVPRPL